MNSAVALSQRKANIMKEKDGQFSSQYNGEDMLIFEHQGESSRHVGTISIKTAKVTFAEPGYESIIEARIAPLMSIRTSLGIK